MSWFKVRSHQVISVVVVVLLAGILWFIWPRSVEHYMDGNAWKMTVTESDGSSDSGTYYFKGKKAYEVEDGIADKDDPVDIQYSGSKDFILDGTDAHVDNKSSDSITGTATDDDEAATFKMVPIKNVTFPKDKKLTAKQVKKQVNIYKIRFNKQAELVSGADFKEQFLTPYKKGSSKDIEGNDDILSHWTYKDEKINTTYDNENQKLTPDKTINVNITLKDVENELSPEEIKSAVQNQLKKDNASEKKFSGQVYEFDIGDISADKAAFSKHKKGTWIYYDMENSKLTPETKKLKFLVKGGQPKFKKVVAKVTLKGQEHFQDSDVSTDASTNYEITKKNGKVKALRIGDGEL